MQLLKKVMSDYISIYVTFVNCIICFYFVALHEYSQIWMLKYLFLFSNGNGFKRKGSFYCPCTSFMWQVAAVKYCCASGSKNKTRLQGVVCVVSVASGQWQRACITMGIWAHYSNLETVSVGVIWNIMVRSGPNFAQAMTAKLSWHVQS